MAFDFQDVVASAVKDLVVSLIVFVLVCASTVWVGGAVFSLLGPVPRISADPLDFFYEGFYIGLRWQIMNILPALVSLLLFVAFFRTEQHLSLAIGTLAAGEFWLTWYWFAAKESDYVMVLIMLSSGALLLGYLSDRWALSRHDQQVERIRAEAKERLRERKEQILRDSMPPD